MYESSMTVVRCAVGVMDGFKVEVGTHQGFALSLYLFASWYQPSRYIIGFLFSFDEVLTHEKCKHHDSWQ